MITSCTAGDPQFTAEAPAGFWMGLWHGIISFITLVIGIFSDSVRVYEVDNTGGWYDFGFLIGATCCWGGSAARNRWRWNHERKREHQTTRSDKEWDEIGQEVEAKIKRKIKAWAEAEPDDEWEVIGAKAEAKLKRKVREWADEP